jgi:hypothetical protein
MIHTRSLVIVGALTTLLATSVATSATVREPARLLNDGDTMREFDGRSDTAQSHDRKMLATIAHARATATLNHATYVYTQHMRLYSSNIKSEMDVLEAEIAMLIASSNHSLTEYGMKSEALRHEAGKLKSSWADGSSPKDLKKLAKIYVDIRQHYLEHAEFVNSEYSKIQKARNRVYVIKFELAKKKIISEEELNEARVQRDQSNAEIAIAAEQMVFAKQALLDAQKDLEGVRR